MRSFFGSNEFLLHWFNTSRIRYFALLDHPCFGSSLCLCFELQIRTLDLADSALLSLDQESAYDLVDHDWIISVFRAIGAPERFLGLLGVIYGSVSLRYIINGYLTGVVHMLCGLGQGDPVSCPVWNVCFQPHLDALVRRKIALDLCAVLLPTRATILTHLAFADDAIVLVSSPAALGLLAGLAVDWRLATNGRSNTAKTTALPLGPGWAQDERTNVVATVRGGEGMTWAGYPVSIDGDL
ncbi:BQ2448_3426 [Microbotryum intermedium]|uniref:BQ2448_3426 protein n=1 Tax=Microbotryum intermedium TaxID=269621 RepID=A0A238FFL4_9BASI|nr:BQ2448_3426 [Microbotryum intermedium]